MKQERNPRIASLLPAATEMLYAMGAGESLAGVSHECDFPPRACNLPRLTSSRLGIEGLSEKIHESVLDLVRNALSIYEVDVERLGAVNPDIIITQDLCDVCAVSYDDVCAAIEKITSHTSIIRLRPERLEDIFGDIRRIGEQTGYASQADRLITTLKARMSHLRETSRLLAARSVLLIEWLNPVMIGGLWSEDLARVAGARALVSDAGAHAKTLERRELAALDPDVVVIKPCGYDLRRSIGELNRLEEYVPWFDWRAVRDGQVYLVDGNAYFNRPGPRIVDSAEILAGCVHNDEFACFRRQYAAGVKRIYPDLSLGDFDE